MKTKEEIEEVIELLSTEQAKRWAGKDRTRAMFIEYPVGILKWVLNGDRMVDANIKLFRKMKETESHAE